MAVESWVQILEMQSMSWTCGHCGLQVGGNRGYYRNDGVRMHTNPNHPSNAPGHKLPAQKVDYAMPRIVICPNCDRPTYFEINVQAPGAAFGKTIQHLPADLGQVYDQARRCMAVAAYVPAVLAARTILMHVAVDQGAKEGETFAFYVDHLVNGGFVPPNARTWVDQIRKRGNDATHKIALMTRDDAEKVLKFVEMILLFLYEYPNLT